VIEVERTVNASGNVSLGDHMMSAGLPLAAQRVTLRWTARSLTSCPAESWPAPSPARCRKKPVPGCAGHAPERRSRRTCLNR